MFHVATIDKEVLMCTFLAGRLRLSYVSIDATHRRIHLDLKQILIESLAENVDDTLSKYAGFEVKKLRSVAVKTESDVGIDQGYALESRDNVVQFSGVRLQKLAACRHVIEEIVDREIASYGAGTRFLARETAARDKQLRPDFVLFLPGSQFHLSHSGNRSQGFSAETHRV